MAKDGGGERGETGVTRIGGEAEKTRTPSGPKIAQVMKHKNCRWTTAGLQLAVYVMRVHRSRFCVSRSSLSKTKSRTEVDEFAMGYKDVPACFSLCRVRIHEIAYGHRLEQQKAQSRCPGTSGSRSPCQRKRQMDELSRLYA